MEDYIHFQKYGKENPLMYFQYFPKYRCWAPWIMGYNEEGVSNYTLAVNHYGLKLPSEL